MIRYKRIHQFCAETGYTDRAVRDKISHGVWIEGRVWRRAPDGHILIDVEGYNEWVEGGLASKPAPSGGASPAPFMGSTPRRKTTKGRTEEGSPPPLVLPTE